MSIHGQPSTGKIGSRFYLHARNQADALLFTLGQNFPAYGEVDRPLRYHIVGEREVDNLEMAKLIAAAVGKPLNFEIVDFHGSRPGHDLRYALDGSRIAADGWKAPIPLEESIERTVKWTLDHPEWLEM
jgi:dTDP-glucose 4,6-dehydratase